MRQFPCLDTVINEKKTPSLFQDREVIKNDFWSNKVTVPQGKSSVRNNLTGEQTIGSLNMSGFITRFRSRLTRSLYGTKQFIPFTTDTFPSRLRLTVRPAPCSSSRKDLSS